MWHYSGHTLFGIKHQFMTIKYGNYILCKIYTATLPSVMSILPNLKFSMQAYADFL